MKKVLLLTTLATVQLTTRGAISIADQAMDNVELQDAYVQDYTNRATVSIKANGSAKLESGLFAKTRSKMNAYSDAQRNATLSAANLCSSTYDFDYSNKECDVDERQQTATCSVDAKFDCYGLDKKDLASLKVRAGLITPSAGCMDYIGDSFKTDNTVAEYCDLINTKEQYKCVEYVTDYSSIKVASIAACSSFDEDSATMGLDTLRSYVGKGVLEMRYPAPDVSTVFLMAAIDTQSEKDCVENRLKTGSVKIHEVEKSCIDDSGLELDEREYNALGFVILPRTVKYGLKKPVSDSARGIFSRIGDLLGL